MQRFGRVHGSAGPLFAGRDTAVLMDNDVHQAALLRYIHLNPAEAKKADELERQIETDRKLRRHLDQVIQTASTSSVQTKTRPLSGILPDNEIADFCVDVPVGRIEPHSLPVEIVFDEFLQVCLGEVGVFI